MNALCWLGFHRRTTVRIFQQETEFAVAYADGDVCERCGHLPRGQAEGALDALAYGPRDRITLHPSVRATLRHR